MLISTVAITQYAPSHTITQSSLIAVYAQSIYKKTTKKTDVSPEGFLFDESKARQIANYSRYSYYRENCDEGDVIMVDIEELAKRLNDYEKRLTRLESYYGDSKKAKTEERDTASAGLNLFLTLISSGFFDQPQFIEAIVEKCDEMGYPTTGRDLKKPLRIAIRSGLLRQIKKDGKWSYMGTGCRNHGGR